MSKLITAAVAAFFVLGTAGAMAQNTPKPQSEIDKLKKDEKAGNKSTGG